MPKSIVFLGMRGAFTHVPFEALLRAGFSVSGLIIPSSSPAADVRELPPPALPMAPVDPVSLAHAAGVPVLEVGRLRSRASLQALDALRPDLICVACFPRLLPAEWLARPALGCLNLHPSLLPAYRGPEPLFWQFREGETGTGVSLHFLDEGVDTGDLVAQAEVPFPDGIEAAEADRLTAGAGARLLVEALSRPELTGRPQPAEGASYFPRPTAEDLVVPTTWPARRAYNFIRGAAGWGPFEVTGPRGRWRARTALRVTHEPSGRHFPSGPDSAWVAFTPGMVELRLA
jgi:methionyl-tRNA formyltransferase